jgi:hypothetical protein
VGSISRDKLGFKKHAIFIVAIVGFGLTILHMIVNRIGYQANAITSFVPIEAEVLGKKFKEWTRPDSSGTFYDFTITYMYKVNGRQFTCNKVSPLGGGLGLKRSKKLYATYKKGQLVQAYYNPANPYQAFLIPHINSRIYFSLLTLVAILCLVIIGYFEAENYAQNKKSFYDPEEEECYWQPRIGVAYNFWKYVALAVGWHTAGLLSLWHYCSVATRPLQLSGIIGMILYEAIGLTWFILVLCSKRSSRIQQVQEHLAAQPQPRNGLVLSDEGLALYSQPEVFVAWSRVKNLFVQPYGALKYGLVVIDEQDIVHFMKTRNVHAQTYRNCLDKWRTAIPVDELEIPHEYPGWVFVKGRRKSIALWCFMAGLLLLSLVIFMLTSTTGLTLKKLMALLSILLGFVALLVLGWLAPIQKKKYERLSAVQDKLSVQYCDGTWHEFYLRNVINHSLDDVFCTSVTFLDGTKLDHLERISYWPILREHLLSKLGQSKKGKINATNMA